MVAALTTVIVLAVVLAVGMVVGLAFSAVMAIGRWKK